MPSLLTLLALLLLLPTLQLQTLTALPPMPLFLPSTATPICNCRRCQRRRRSKEKGGVEEGKQADEDDGWGSASGPGAAELKSAAAGD